MLVEQASSLWECEFVNSQHHVKMYEHTYAYIWMHTHVQMHAQHHVHAYTYAICVKVLCMLQRSLCGSNPLLQILVLLQCPSWQLHLQDATYVLAVALRNA